MRRKVTIPGPVRLAHRRTWGSMWRNGFRPIWRRLTGRCNLCNIKPRGCCAANCPR